MTRLLLATLAFYQRWLSPAIHTLSPGGCKYLPTCSEYAAIARGGLDPVPPAVHSHSEKTFSL
jgi:putative component of membrane protein insertase Oxa1/YidC/SpoIIIJ protein YidD